MVVTIGAGVTIEVQKHGGIGAVVSALQSHGQWGALMNPYTFAGPSFVWLGIGTGALLGLPAMENWQRVDAATSSAAARRAFVWSGVLNAVFFAAAMTLGLVAAASLPADTPSNLALYRLIQTSLPPGLVGLAIVGLFAAIMSTANSMLMVSVAVLLTDLLYAGHSRLEGVPRLLQVMRRLTWIVGLAGLAIAYWRPEIVTLIQTALWGSGILLPALIGGLFWRRATSHAALASVLVGFPLNFGLSLVNGWADVSWIPALATATAVFVAVSLAERETEPDVQANGPVFRGSGRRSTRSLQ
jgi:SSS family solute:Na+ symporter